MQALGKAKSGEGLGEIVLVLREVSPSLIVDRDDGRVRKVVGDFESVVGAHGQIEGAAHLGSACEQQNYFQREAAGNFGGAFLPDGVAGSVDSGADFRRKTGRTQWRRRRWVRCPEDRVESGWR